VARPHRALTLPDRVTETACGLQCGVLEVDLFGPAPPPQQDVLSAQASCQACVSRPAAEASFDGAQEHLVLGGEPGKTVVVVGEGFRGHAGVRRRELDRCPGRTEQLGGGVRGVQVVIEEPVQRGPALIVAVMGVGLFAGVGTQQVMQGVSAGCGLGEQVCPGQLDQQAAGPDRRPGRPGAAPAGAVKSGPGCRPSSRNNPAAAGLRAC